MVVFKYYTKSEGSIKEAMTVAASAPQSEN